jgi:hypothetical protein
LTRARPARYTSGHDARRETHRARRDLREDPEDPDDETGPVVGTGTYQVRLVFDGTECMTRVEVGESIWLEVAG